MVHFEKKHFFEVGLNCTFYLEIIINFVSIKIILVSSHAFFASFAINKGFCSFLVFMYGSE